MKKTTSPIEQLFKPVSRFIHQEYTGGIVLFISVLIALIWANSAASHGYYELWETKLAINFAGRELNASLHTWINDGLMALFFFVIGLELKREFMVGELSTPRKAMLPLMAAIGGMVVPASIYLLVNMQSGFTHGWGIPMATDIAFALGLLSLAGKHVPTSLKVFLSALAVADDLGAVLVIAFFYTTDISMMHLAIGGIILLMLLAGSLLGVRQTGFYVVLGMCVWLCFLLSGVHATIAGVLVALTIPARTKINEAVFVQKLRTLTSSFENAIPQKGALTTPEQHIVIEKIKKACVDAETPLQKIEHALHPWVALLIMPLFALANAGMHIDSDFLSSLSNPVSIGVGLGLLVGKFVGVFSFVWIMVRLKYAELPQFTSWRHIAGVSALAGVGFTMSLFVTSLAFNDSTLIENAKYGILLSSFIAGLAGLLILRRAHSM